MVPVLFPPVLLLLILHLEFLLVIVFQVPKGVLYFLPDPLNLDPGRRRRLRLPIFARIPVTDYFCEWLFLSAWFGLLFDELLELYDFFQCAVQLLAEHFDDAAVLAEGLLDVFDYAHRYVRYNLEF